MKDWFKNNTSEYRGSMDQRKGSMGKEKLGKH